MSASFKIGYEGVAGAHSEHAIQQLFSSQPAWKAADGEAVPYNTVALLLKAVEDGQVKFGIVPIENSIAGSFFPVLDQIVLHNVHIVGEFEHEEIQVLAALPGVALKDVKEVHSHPYAFDQCRPFLASPEMADKKLVQSLDTAGSCMMIKEKSAKELGAIASGRAASLYGLNVISEIASEKSVTRFVLVGKDVVIPERHLNPRTSLQVVLKNQIGAL
jgi:prephenate dehydratase